jgi:hypothetical protein
MHHLYLPDIGDSKWTASSFPRFRFGMVTTIISESNNSWLLNERDETWFSCLSNIVRKTQQRMFDKRIEYGTMASKFTPWVVARVMKNFNLARKRLVSGVTEDIFEVIRESSRTYVTVDMARKECSCRFWQEYQFPCVHACAAMMLRREDPLEYVVDYYLACHLREVYEPYSRTLDVAYLEPDGTLPPRIDRRRGRPKKIRIRNRSEFINDDSPIHCGICGGKGHNRRTYLRRSKQRIRNRLYDSSNGQADEL